MAAPTRDAPFDDASAKAVARAEASPVRLTGAPVVEGLATLLGGTLRPTADRRPA